MSSSSIICVLCRNCLVNKCDKNLVDTRKNTVFNARQEILSLDIKVQINSTHICRNCLPLLKERRALLKNLGEVNNKIHDTVKSLTRDFILPVSLSATPELSCIEGKFKEQPAKQIALEDLRSSTDQRHASDMLSNEPSSF